MMQYRDPRLVPQWEQREPNNPQCKCLKIKPSSLAHRIEYEQDDVNGAFSAMPSDDGCIIAMRCRYVDRKSGCRHGDDCEFCHVHPWGGGKNHWLEPDNSLIVERKGQFGSSWGHKLNRKERAKQKLDADRNAAVQTRLVLYQELRLAAQQDAQMFINYGKPLGEVHFFIWSVHKIGKTARQTQAYVADLFGCEANDIGILLGVDNLCQSAQHYPNGTGHGVHTLMKGLRTRLLHLIKHTTAKQIIIMEADCRPVEGLRYKLQWLESLISDTKFCWLGFFTSEAKNWLGRKSGKPIDELEPSDIPLFKSIAEGNVFPKYGCQMFSIAREEIPQWVERMGALPRPHGLDMWFFSPDHFADKDFKFTNRSLAGQRNGWSESWQKIAPTVGLVDSFWHTGQVRLRDFSEGDLPSYRHDEWHTYLCKCYKSKRWEGDQSYRMWQVSGNTQEEVDMIWGEAMTDEIQEYHEEMSYIPRFLARKKRSIWEETKGITEMGRSCFQRRFEGPWKSSGHDHSNADDTQPENSASSGSQDPFDHLGSAFALL